MVTQNRGIPKTKCSAAVRILVRNINAYLIRVSSAFQILNKIQRAQDLRYRQAVVGKRGLWVVLGTA